MDRTSRVDVGTLLSSIAEMMEDNKQNLNSVDTGERGGTHGDRIASAFRMAARAAQQSRSDDAGRQLAIAAQAMRENGRGKAVGFYADGLEDAAQQFSGQSGISIDNLAPFLQAFLGGVQRNNPAQPGQGTMIDALAPAVGALINNQGGDPRRSALEALTEAVTGARGTARDGRVDPGAASATNVIGGIVSALLPGLISALMSRGGGLGGILGGGRSSQRDMRDMDLPQPQVDRDSSDSQSSGGGLGDILGQIMGGRDDQSRGPVTRRQAEDNGPLGDLGDILGQLGGMGRQQTEPDPRGTGGKPVWWPF